MKALVVSTTPRSDVQRCLLEAGSKITVAQNGEEAIRCAEHAAFDMAVIVSTGEHMDLVETYLNIRELKPSIEIVLLAQSRATDEESTAYQIATWFGRTHALTVDELAEFLRQQGPLPS
jgi:DNA-binding NarL/FixJ family response regulator